MGIPQVTNEFSKPSLLKTVESVKVNLFQNNDNIKELASKNGQFDEKNSNIISKKSFEVNNNIKNNICVSNFSYSNISSANECKIKPCNKIETEANPAQTEHIPKQCNNIKNTVSPTNCSNSHSKE